MRFSKWHALGNSYVVAERVELGRPFDAELARRLCDLRYGIGSDGVLEVVAANDARAEVVIWNPDGSVAEFSGNGSRIAAVHDGDLLGSVFRNSGRRPCGLDRGRLVRGPLLRPCARRGGRAGCGAFRARRAPRQGNSDGRCSSDSGEVAFHDSSSMNRSDNRIACHAW